MVTEQNMELCNRVRLLCFKYENAVLAHSSHQKHSRG